MSLSIRSSLTRQDAAGDDIPGHNPPQANPPPRLSASDVAKTGLSTVYEPENSEPILE
jgi:hypothetical protein